MTLSMQNLTIKYGDVTAVTDLSLEVVEGEMLVLLGPSGCGKSSTMRSVAGLERPTAGSITIGGQTVFDAERGIEIPPNKRRTGMVFQSYAIWPHMTVERNVDYPLRRNGTPRSQWKALTEKALELVGLEDLGSRGASRLSGGQMQRVALARSVVMEPEVLLLDEPLSNLDAKLRERLRFELKAIQRRLNLTSIYVTHDQSEALALADRIVVMREGLVEQVGSPMEVYRNPKNRFVADFLGVTNVWPVEAVLRSEGGDPVLAVCGERIPYRPKPAEREPRYASIRPEAVSVAFSEPEAGGLVLKGEVSLHSFMGTHNRFEVKTSGGLRVDVVEHGTAETVDRTGDRIWLIIDPDDVNVFSE